MPLKERIAASVLIASLTFGGAGCQDINATKPTTTVTETTPSSTTPTTETTIETTPTTTETTKPTTETTTAPTTTKPTIETTPSLTPEEVLLVKYDQELKECKPELKSFCAHLLNIYDVSSKDSETLFNNITKYTSRQEIIKYGETGKGLQTVEDEYGKLALFGWSEKSVSIVESSINRLKQVDESVLKVLNDNGTYAFMLGQSNTWPDRTYGFTKEGLTCWNSNNERAEQGTKYWWGSKLIIENIGTAMINLGGEYDKIKGFMKEIVAGDEFLFVSENKAESSKDMVNYKETSDGCYRWAGDSYYNNVYAPRKFDDKDVQELVKTIYDEKLISFFGGTPEEIAKTAMYHSILD